MSDAEEDYGWGDDDEDDGHLFDAELREQLIGLRRSLAAFRRLIHIMADSDHTTFTRTHFEFSLSNEEWTRLKSYIGI